MPLSEGGDRDHECRLGEQSKHSSVAGIVPSCRKMAIVTRSAASLGLLEEARTIRSSLVSASHPFRQVLGLPRGACYPRL